MKKYLNYKLLAFLVFGYLGVSGIHGATQINVLQLKTTGTPLSNTYLSGTGAWSTPTAVLADGNYTDITVGSSGTSLTINSNAVTLPKIANIATASILGRNTAGTGNVEVLSTSTLLTLLNLNNVNNTNDLSKPISTLTQAALDLKVSLSKFVFDEVPTGLINGTNTSYSLLQTPVTGTVRIYYNGLRNKVGGGNDYTISGGTITYLTAPPSGTTLSVDYIAQ